MSVQSVPAIYRFDFDATGREVNHWGWYKMTDLVTIVNHIIIFKIKRMVEAAQL